MQTEQLILTAINTVRQAFGHGRFIDPTDLSTPAAVAAIQKYLAAAPSINDDTLLLMSIKVPNCHWSSFHIIVTVKSSLARLGPGLC
jgi:hypothetical protein